MKYVSILKGKAFQMVLDMKMGKRDVQCAVFFWEFTVPDVHVVVRYWEQKQEVKNNGKASYNYDRWR